MNNLMNDTRIQGYNTIYPEEETGTQEHESSMADHDRRLEDDPPALTLEERLHRFQIRIQKKTDEISKKAQEETNSYAAMHHYAIANALQIISTELMKSLYEKD